MPDNNLKSLPPDLYSRNTIIANLIHRLITKPDFRVLDVGGKDSRLNEFLDNGCKYTLLDKKQPSGPVGFTYLVGDAKKIPFSDRNFEVVVSSDMMEHVEDADREKVLTEMLRVCKQYLILGAPFKNSMVETAEEFVRTQYLANSGRPHPFLIEHDTYGLPDEEKLDAILTAKGLNFIKINEGNLMNWYLQQLYTGSRNGDEIGEAYKFNNFYNEHLSELGNLREPTYRIIYCISKEESLSKAEIMADLHSKNIWKAEMFMELLKTAFDDLKTVIDRKKHALNKLHQELNLKQNEIVQVKSQYDETITVARRSVEAHRHAILELRNFLAEKEKALQFLKLTLVQKVELLKTAENENFSLKERVNDLLADIETVRESNASLEKELFLQKEKNNIIDVQKQELEAVKTDLASHRSELVKVKNSRAWKAVLLYGKVKNAVILQPAKLIKKGWKILTVLGPNTFWQRLIKKVKRSVNLPEDKTPYDLYVEKNRLSEKNREEINAAINKFVYHPVVSIVMPVYNIETKWLIKAIESVKAQFYPRWELCICDDASDHKEILPLLKKYAAEDKRIKIKSSDKNGGIVRASNQALKLASGAYVSFLDNDDELSPNALYEIVKSLQENKFDLVYSDEDKIDPKGKFCEPHFKPDWSPDLLLSNNYICHFAVYKRKLVDDLGGLREGFDGSQDYDLLLRFTEKTASIRHLPKVLYHWRMLPGSAALDINAKPYAYLSARKALEEAMERRKIKAEVLDGTWKGSYRVHRGLSKTALVSIIIPFKDKIEYLKKCVNSILEKSTYRDYEIILVDNRSVEAETRAYLQQLADHPRIKVLKYDQPFNYSALNNFAVSEAAGDVVILLNNDIEVLTPSWIENMLEHALRPEVGAVGAKLLYPNRTIQHAGVIVGLGGIANCAFCKNLAGDPGYFGQADVVKNYSAVTGACLMVRKDLYEKIGGLDEKNLAVTFNDIDFCLRLREKGYLVVYTPYAQLVHHESVSRGYEVDLKEVDYMQKKYAPLLKSGDPFYNPNLTRERLDFSLRVLDRG